eukprot:1844145-Amphidinium_carterae.2
MSKKDCSSRHDLIVRNMPCSSKCSLSTSPLEPLEFSGVCLLHHPAIGSTATLLTATVSYTHLRAHETEADL